MNVQVRRQATTGTSPQSILQKTMFQTDSVYYMIMCMLHRNISIMGTHETSFPKEMSLFQGPIIEEARLYSSGTYIRSSCLKYSISAISLLIGLNYVVL